MNYTSPLMISTRDLNYASYGSIASCVELNVDIGANAELVANAAVWTNAVVATLVFVAAGAVLLAALFWKTNVASPKSPFGTMRMMQILGKG